MQLFTFTPEAISAHNLGPTDEKKDARRVRMEENAFLRKSERTKDLSYRPQFWSKRRQISPQGVVILVARFVVVFEAKLREMRIWLQNTATEKFSLLLSALNRSYLALLLSVSKIYWYEDVPVEIPALQDVFWMSERCFFVFLRFPRRITHRDVSNFLVPFAMSWRCRKSE